MDHARVSGDADARGVSRWLVTGAGGQLGRAFSAVAEAAGVHAFPFGSAELDVSDPVAIASALDAVQPNVVLNCAAFTEVDRCEDEKQRAERVNARAPGLLAEACRGRALLVHISTETVFSGEGSRPISEEEQPGPRSVYGRSKLAGEQAVRQAGSEHLIVRTQWLFGPGPNFVRTILRAAGQGGPLRVVEDQLGRPTWSGALAPALPRAVRAGARGTLHLACEGISSWYDLARAAVAEGFRRGLCPEVPVEPIATSQLVRPAERPAYGVLGLARARELGLGLPHWREALVAYLEAEGEGRDA